MRKKLIPLLLAGVLCIGSLIWMTAPRTALLDNDFPSGEEPGSSIEIVDGGVPMTDLPEPVPEEEEDPFDQFTEEQRAAMDEVLDLVNQARSEAGLTGLELDPALCGAAQVRARECVTSFSHTRPDGTKYKTAISEAGITSSYTGENVATGYTSAKQVVDAWLRSEGHKANILSEKFTKLGVGFESNSGGHYGGRAWSQLFVK